jgi:hypothetical protein
MSDHQHRSLAHFLGLALIALALLLNGRYQTEIVKSSGSPSVTVRTDTITGDVSMSSGRYGGEFQSVAEEK